MLPPPAVRFREHLREIRRLVSETCRQTFDIQDRFREQFATLNALAGQQTARLSRVEARLDELVAGSRCTETGLAVVLAYHRVADPAADPFELAVSPEQFAAHLELLSTMGPIVSVADLSDRLDNGTLTGVSFALTFDDGYADNLYAAKPILERYDAPATVFVATDFVGGKPFWWDELAHLVVNDGARCEELTLELDGVSHSWQLKETELQQVCYEVWELVRPLDGEERSQALARFGSQVRSHCVEGARSLTESEMAELIGGGLIDVGAHTKTHPLLTSVTADAARREVEGSKARLERWLERRVMSFAYPYGEYGTRDVEIVRRAGFEIAFSTVEGAVTVGSDRLQVPRVSVGHLESGDLEKILRPIVGASRVGVSVPRSLELGQVDLGDLRRLEPISRDWGIDRGQPVDRYYIEAFIEQRTDAIAGRVLEFEEPRYTTMFGDGRVTRVDVLDVVGGAAVTYRCRLEEGHELPSDSFDCIICTQVLQYIYDIGSAMRTLHRVLKPGGSLLLTVPGITPARDGDEYGDAWYWSFTEASTSRLCKEAFGEVSIETEVFGNVLAGAAFLHGLAVFDVTPDQLDYLDPDYQVIIGAQVMKPLAP